MWLRREGANTGRVSLYGKTGWGSSPRFLSKDIQRSMGNAEMGNGDKYPELGSFDAIPDAVIAVDREGSIVHANVHAGRLFGYEQGRLVGLPLETLLPERFRKRHTGFVGQFFAEPVARPMGRGRELFAIRGDGEEFPVEIAIGPIQGGDLAIAVIRDITEIVRTRDELANTLKDVQQLKERLQRESRYLKAEIKGDHNFD